MLFPSFAQFLFKQSNIIGSNRSTGSKIFRKKCLPALNTLQFLIKFPMIIADHKLGPESTESKCQQIPFRKCTQVRAGRKPPGEKHSFINPSSSVSSGGHRQRRNRTTAVPLSDFFCFSLSILQLRSRLQSSPCMAAGRVVRKSQKTISINDSAVRPSHDHGAAGMHFNATTAREIVPWQNCKMTCPTHVPGQTTVKSMVNYGSLCIGERAILCHGARRFDVPRMADMLLRGSQLCRWQWRFCAWLGKLVAMKVERNAIIFLASWLWKLFWMRWTENFTGNSF